MTGLLKGLAARFAPQATAPIQPRPTFRFEGEGEAEGFQEIDAETRTTAATPRAAPPERLASSAPTRSTTPQVTDQTPLTVSADPFVAAPGNTPTAAERAEGIRTPAPDRSEGVEAENAGPAAPHFAQGTRVEVEHTYLQETLRERVDNVQVVQSAPTAPAYVNSPEDAPQAMPEFTAPEAAPAEPRAEAVAEPTTPAPSIRIGRIEVRAPAKPAPPPAPPRAAPAPSTQTARPAPAPSAPARSGLTDYLGWRR